jgi:ketosteroid isomerase-like protein
MKNIILVSAIALTGFTTCALAQTTPVTVSKVITAEDNFDKAVAKKGIKDAFLDVADPEGIVFKPNAVKITDFYNNIQKQPGTLKWEPKFARISAGGDLAFTAGPYVYQNGKTDDDKVFGDYVSIWRADSDGKLKLLIDVGIQHPEPEQNATVDFKDPNPNKKVEISKDPFNGKKLIVGTDNTFNHAASTLSTLATYKEFLSPEGRFYFPGFEPMTGQDKILKFLENEAISISAETVNAGRSLSNDLAYTYGRARIKKGNIVSNYNYVRIWEIDSTHRWNILLEIFSAVEND